MRLTIVKRVQVYFVDALNRRLRSPAGNAARPSRYIKDPALLYPQFFISLRNEI